MCRERRRSLNVGDPCNARNVDLTKAARNSKGEVEISGEFLLLKPVDLRKDKHRQIYKANAPSHSGKGAFALRPLR